MNKDIKILIVDDDSDVLFATSRIVKSEGYQVINASSGAECRDLAQKHHPDLILLDVMLPDIEGPELCKEMKSDPLLKGIFIILISGMKTSSAEQADGLDVGADGYIARPISNQELKARVKAMVRILIAERERDRLIQELQKALLKIRELSGLLPICSHCKKIRDGKGYWNQIEAYIQDHSEAAFSHSICKECAEKYYPDMNLYDEDETQQ
jgi:response regulator RpfG family c-di-GMP phosphodiesterase